ncbi:MAG: ABC transporter substrate-binding protein [Mariprofundaceae bacterium]
MAADSVKIHLKWLHQFQSAGYLAAIEKGFYQDEGLNVELIEGGPGRTPMEDMLSKKVQYAVSDAGALLYRAQGHPVVDLANIFQHSPQIIICRADSAPHTPANLAGKRIMLQHGFLTIEVLAVLEKFGIQKKDFIRQPIGSLDDLIQEKTDAWPGYSTNEPFLLEQHGIPFQTFSPRDYDIDFYGDMLVTTESEIDLHPDRAAAFSYATLKGWQYALTYPDEIVELIFKKYNTQNKTRAHLAFEARAISDLMFSDVIQIGYTNPSRWQDIANIYAQYDLIPANFSMEGFLYSPKPKLGDVFKEYQWEISVALLIALVAFLILHWFTQRLAIIRNTLELRDSNQLLSDEIEERKEVETKLVTAKQQAEQASKAKTEFLSVMSHELRTPLHGIIGLLDLMHTETLPEQHRQDLNMARQSAKSLQTLVSDILDLSKVEAGKLTLEQKAFEFESCITDVLRTFIIPCQDKGIDLTVDLTDVPETLLGDPVRIRQILVNLIGNAVKFTEAGSIHLQVTPHRSDDQTSLHFTVKDTGIGMSQEALGSIFEAFTQVQTLMHRQHGGTGLGTTIAKRLVEHMDGTIWAKSQLGKGSTFGFSIPCLYESPLISRHFNIHSFKHDDDLSSPHIPIPSLKGSSLEEQNWKILLTEDDLISQKIALKRLSDSGFHTDLAKNGQEAWEMVQQNDYDLILMDLRMPKIDGLTLTKKIRDAEKPNHKHTPIIGLSAHAMENVQQDCLNAGMDAFLTKPIEPKLIIAHMQKMLDITT